MKKNTIILPLSLLLFALTALSGGYWDVWWHVMKLVETFYTLPHLVIYASIFLSGITVLGVVFIRLRKIGSFSPAKIKEAKSLALIGAGSVIQLIAGISDDIYHNLVGFDITIWSPPHLLVIFGGVLLLLGVFQLSHERNFTTGMILSLGFALAFFQFSIMEYDIHDVWSLENRWEPYKDYLPFLFMSCAALIISFGTVKMKKPMGTLVTGIAFIYKLAVYIAWSFTSIELYFPVLIIVCGVVFDLVYLLTKNTKYRIHIAAIIAGAALSLVVALQSPINESWSNIVISIAGAIVSALIFTWLGKRLASEGGYHA
ncbi:hypothetical protein [Ectobacillus funiculus]|uniref:DUF998 domain-containing protein n=1 Tax=Ectobacillus funiculus TaxID=137993 RepID=A0ABV5WEK4_9BACI